MIFSQVFFELLCNLTDFVISNDSTEKMTSKSIRIYPVFIKKRLKVNKKSFSSSEKKRNSEVIISIIKLTRSSEMIFNPMRYTGL